MQDETLDLRELLRKSAALVRQAAVASLDQPYGMRARLGDRKYSVLLLLAIAISADGSFGPEEEAELNRMLTEAGSPLMAVFQVEEPEATAEDVGKKLRSIIEEENLLGNDEASDSVPDGALDFALTKFLVLAKDVLGDDSELCALLLGVIKRVAYADQCVSPKEQEVLEAMKAVLTTVQTRQV